MGSFQDFVCGQCIKEKEDEDSPDDNYDKRESCFIPDEKFTQPKNVTDLKVDAKNFITKSSKNVFDIYEIISELGNGAFGRVYKVKRKNSGMNPIIRALKEISKEQMETNEGSSAELKNEIEILKELDHPNIMKIYESFHRVFLARKYRLKRMNPRSFWIQNIEKNAIFGLKSI